MPSFCRSASLLLGLVVASTGAALSAADGDKFWPQWRGPDGTGRVAAGETAARVERNEEHPLEEGDPRTRRRHAGHLGRPRSSVSTAVPVGVDRSRSARRARQSSRHPQVRRHGARPQGRPRRLGARRPRGHAARGHPPGMGHLGVALDRHRRHARHRVVRVARHLRLRHEGHAGLAEGSRRQDDAQPVRRGQLAGAARQHARRRLGSPGRVVHRRARQADGRRDAGARRATRSIRGRRRSSSSQAAARRSSRAG